MTSLFMSRKSSKAPPPPSTFTLFDQTTPRPNKRKNVPVRPSPEQLELLHQRKSSFGYKSLSKYLIERGLRESPIVEIIDAAKIDRLLFEVRKLGVNLNQIARRLHETKRQHSAAVIERAIEEAAGILLEVSKAINK